MERRVGRKLPTVKVLGKLYFESPDIEIGENVVLWPNVTFAGTGKIIIENGVKLGANCTVYAYDQVCIGENTIIAALTYIIDSDHGFSADKSIQSQGLIADPVRIGKDCWLGTNTVVLRGSIIGDGAVIGAKSLVRSEITKNAIAVGIPARKIKTRE